MEENGSLIGKSAFLEYQVDGGRKFAECSEKRRSKAPLGGLFAPAGAEPIKNPAVGCELRGFSYSNIIFSTY